MRIVLLISVMFILSAASARSAKIDGILSQINLQPGFNISVFGEMSSPRQIEINPKNAMIFIGSRHGHIHSMIDKNRDGVADEIVQRATGLNVPNGVAISDDHLFIGLQSHIVKWPISDDHTRTINNNALQTIKDNLHNHPHHGWRYIDFGPDGKLYISIGAPCNICTLNDNTGKIFRINPDGTSWELVADGVRNSVGFDWHPITGDMWFTDNGADGMGDDIPSDELNRVTKIGQHFGFPFLGGANTKLDGFENHKSTEKYTAPELEFQAHSANLGIDFYSGNMFPDEYQNDAFVVQHGSWDRSDPVGYRIMRVKFDEKGNAIDKEVFADGWLQDGAPIGRPVDIEELPDGSILVSDDYADVIYRISYTKPN